MAKDPGVGSSKTGKASGTGTKVTVPEQAPPTPFEALQAVKAVQQVMRQNLPADTAGGSSQVFQYSGDIGVNAIPYIISLQRSSGIVLAVVSDYRPGDPGYHGSQNAVDFAGSTESMRQVAAYMYQYSPFWLELIHTNPLAPGGGYYVHNGQKVGQSFYDGPDITTGGNIIDGHRDHIHAASTVSAMRAASQASTQDLQQVGPSIYKDGSNDSPTAASDVWAQVNSRLAGDRKGCAKPAAAFVTALPVTGYGLYELIRYIVGG